MSWCPSSRRADSNRADLTVRGALMDLDSPPESAPYAPGTTPMPGVGYLLDDERAVALAARLRREGDLPTLGVTRLVVFLTERCNMRCGYCLSIHHPMPRWREEAVLGLLTRQAAAGCAHVQWTGGEASLHPRVVDFVAVSSSLGMNNSTSTNGSAPPERYRDLVRAGMTRFYVSLDTLNAARFDEMTGSRGLLPRVLETLRLLVGLRDAGRDVFVTVNTLLRADRVDAAAGRCDARCAGCAPPAWTTSSSCRTPRSTAGRSSAAPRSVRRSPPCAPRRCRPGMGCSTTGWPR